MVGPSGFVERFKGKYTASPGSVWIGAIPQYGPATQLNANPTSTGSTVIVGAQTVARINNSSTSAFVRLPSISYIGQVLAVEIFGGGSTSTAVYITAASGQTFLGSSFSVIRSTANLTIELQATSTSNWAIMGTFSTGTSTGGAANQSLVFSTTT